MLASGSDPTWDLSAMFWLHNVPSAHSFPFVKQDRATCHRNMRTVYCQNVEQVSRTVLTLRFQFVCHGPPGSWHATVARLGSDRSGCPTTRRVHIQLGSMKIGKSLGQLPKVAAHAVEWRRVLSLARSIGAYCEALCENV